MLTISKGESRIFRRNLYQPDKTTAISLSSCNLVQVKLRQAGVTLVTYIKGTDTQLREGSASTNQIELEVTSTLSATFAKGYIEAEWTVKLADSNFSVDGFNNQQWVENILNVTTD